MVDTENYIYERHKDNVKKTRTYWRCEKFYSGCHARIHTDYNAAEPIILQTVGSHTHSSSNAEVECRKAINAMQDKVENSDPTVSTREVIASTL